ncbi:MAG TPA: hypothetical protein VKV17_21630 [Bryobacteraceae bacterium]|nr:hypothetical protein [Bryobacteraceae bacterium]
MPPKPASRRPAIAVLGASGLLSLKFFLFISVFAVNVFYFDQWAFLTPFFRGNPGLRELFLWQHGPPRLGLGLVLVKPLYEITHWNTRVEGFCAGACIFLAMCLALWLKTKLSGGFSYWDVAIPLIFLTLTQYETFLGATNPAYGAIPLLLILVYCLGLLLPNHLVRYLLIVALNFLLIYTGFGFFMGLVTLAAFAYECLRRIHGRSQIPLAHSIVAGLLAAASLASFFVHYRFDPAADCFGHAPWTWYPRFIALTFSAFLGPRTPFTLVTVAGFVGLAVALAFFGMNGLKLLHSPEKKAVPRSERARLIIAVLMGYSMLFTFSAAAGRACLAPEAGQAPRYSTLMIPVYFGIYLFLLMLPPGFLRTVALPLFLLVVAPGGVLWPNDAGKKLADGKRAWAACFLAHGDVRYCDRETGFPIYPNPESIDLQGKLNYLKQHRLSFFYDASQP